MQSCADMGPFYHQKKTQSTTPNARATYIHKYQNCSMKGWLEFSDFSYSNVLGPNPLLLDVGNGQRNLLTTYFLVCPSHFTHFLP